LTPGIALGSSDMRSVFRVEAQRDSTIACLLD
jgi:hypothetical protein